MSTKPQNPSQNYPPLNYILLNNEGEPYCFHKAYEEETRKKWKKAMDSLLKNETWELVKLPKGINALQNKWVYRIKNEGEEKKEIYKARLVVKGFT